MCGETENDLFGEEEESGHQIVKIHPSFRKEIVKKVYEVGGRGVVH